MSVLALPTENTSTLDAIIHQIFVTQQITRIQQEKLLLIVRSDEQIKQKEIQRINQIMDRLKSGRFQVVD